MRYTDCKYIVVGRENHEDFLPSIFCILLCCKLLLYVDVFTDGVRMDLRSRCRQLLNYKTTGIVTGQVTLTDRYRLGGNSSTTVAGSLAKHIRGITSIGEPWIIMRTNFLLVKVCSTK